MKVEPNYAEALSKLSFVYLFLDIAEEPLAKAYKTARNALNLKPKKKITQKHIGDVLLYDKKYNKAIEYYKNSLKIDPNYIKAINNLGICFSELNKLSVALKHFNICIELNPDFKEAWINRGIILS